MNLDRTSANDSFSGAGGPHEPAAQGADLDPHYLSTTGDALAAAGELRIEFDTEDRRGEFEAFQPGEITIGRRPRNDMVLDGPSSQIVSGYHARILTVSGAWWIEDRGSTNGTYLNGARIEARERIHDGDLIELGRPRNRGAVTAMRLRVRLMLARELQNPSSGTSGAASGATSGVEDASPQQDDSTSAAAQSGLDPDSTVGFDLNATQGTDPLEDTSESAGPDTGQAPLEEQGAWDMTLPPPVPRSSPIEPPIRSGVAPAGEHPVAGDPPSTDEQMTLPPDEPAAAPAASALSSGDVKSRMEEIRGKSLRLGEVGYRLNALVQSIADECLRAPEATGLASLPGGAELLSTVADRDGLEAEIQSLEEALPKERESLASELAPLEAEAERAGGEVNEAQSTLASATERDEADERAYEEAAREARSALDVLIAPVVRVDESTDGDEPGDGDEPAWKGWSTALRASLEDVEGREGDLVALHSAHRESAEARATAAEAMRAAKSELEAVQERVAGRRAQLEQVIADNESRTSEARAQLETKRSAIERDAKATVHAALDDPDALADVEHAGEARELHQESTRLEAELESLQSAF